MKTFVLTVIFALATTVASYAQVNITIDGQVYDFDPPARIVSERTLLPLRAVFYAIEPEVEITWDEATRGIQVLTPLSDVIELGIDSLTMVINTNPVILDVGPQLIDEVTFVPVRAVAQALGAEVYWDAETGTVVISRRDYLDALADYVFVQHITLRHIHEELDTLELEQEVLALVNELRAEHDLPPVQWHEALAQVAREHSQDMAERNFISHTGSDGSEVGERMERHGLHPRRYAENVAIMQQTAEQVMEGWYNSPGHRENLLRDIEYIGIGVKRMHHEVFQIFAWTQKFMTP